MLWGESRLASASSNPSDVLVRRGLTHHVPYCEPVVDFITLHPFDFDRNLFNFLVRSIFCHKLNSIQSASQSTVNSLTSYSLATAATDVGIYGLLASQSCYHSMLVPCWFTL